MTHISAQVCVRALDAEACQGRKHFQFTFRIWLFKKTCQQHLMSYFCLPVPVEVWNDDVAEPALQYDRLELQ